LTEGFLGPFLRSQPDKEGKEGKEREKKKERKERGKREKGKRERGREDVGAFSRGTRGVHMDLCCHSGSGLLSGLWNGGKRCCE